MFSHVCRALKLRPVQKQTGFLRVQFSSFTRSSSSLQTNAMDPRASAVLEFWISKDCANLRHDYFNEEWFKTWFQGGEQKDKEIKEKFGADVEDIAAGKLDHWRTQSPYECLAGIILMDQFTRNMYRGTKEMYSLDPQARQWAAYLRDQPEYDTMHAACCFFVLLPFMHGETLEDQEMAVKMCSGVVEKLKAAVGAEHPMTAAMSNSLEFSIEHKDVVEKWGRFPHRNVILERESTPEELAGLEDGSIQAF